MVSKVFKLGNLTYERVTVTSRIAREWLELRPANQRKEKWHKIPGYARDMKTGKWDSDSGETMKFNTLGEFIDGQNRALAVIEAGVPIDFDVVKGVIPKTMRVIDTGVPRNAADVMAVAGSPDKSRVGGVVRWMIMWDLQNYTRSTRGKDYNSPTMSEIYDRYLLERDIFVIATHRGMDCQRRNLGSVTVAGTAFFLFSRIDYEQAQSFFEQYISGANLPDRSPILALRERMGLQSNRRHTPVELMALFIRAWNAFREDREIGLLVAVGTDKKKLNNWNFPMPR